MVQKVGIRIGLLVLIVAASNLVYTLFLFPNDFKEYSPELQAIKQSIDSTDVYYFGESSNTSFVYQDSSYNSISKLCSQFFPNLYFRNVNKEATHAGIYARWLKMFDENKRYPKALIITLNLRSFNAAWIHSSIENSLQEALVFSNSSPALVNRFFLSLQAFSHKTDEEADALTKKDWREQDLRFPYETKYSTVKHWDDLMADGGHLNADGTWNGKKIELACHYIKAYALALDSENVRVQDFDQIYKWCGNHGVKLYLNLMAENVQYADSLVGKDLVFLMRRNHDFLVNRYNRAHCRVADNFDKVEGKLFIDQNWTTEHYLLKGRMVIAKNLAEEIKKDFKTEFVKAY